MKVLGLIPARADSTGCPGKNLRVLGSKMLVQWTVDAWLAVGLPITDLVISTESPDIMRPFHGSGIRLVDQGPRTDDPTRVIDQVLDFWPETEILLYLQPTTPFKRPGDIVKSIEMIGNSECVGVFTGMRIPHQFHPDNVFRENEIGDVRHGDDFQCNRKGLLRTFARDGGVYAVRVSNYRSSRSLYPFNTKVIRTDPIDYCNIDTEEDWKEAQWRAAEIERVKVVA